MKACKWKVTLRAKQFKAEFLYLEGLVSQYLISPLDIICNFCEYIYIDLSIFSDQN